MDVSSRWIEEVGEHAILSKCGLVRKLGMEARMAWRKAGTEVSRGDEAGGRCLAREFMRMCRKGVVTKCFMMKGGMLKTWTGVIVTCRHADYEAGKVRCT